RAGVEGRATHREMRQKILGVMPVRQALDHALQPGFCEGPKKEPDRSVDAFVRHGETHHTEGQRGLVPDTLSSYHRRSHRISRDMGIAMRLMSRSVGITFLTACLAVTLVRPGDAHGQGNLTLYCSPQIEWCQLMIAEFTRATGLKVAMTRKSSGETFA